MSRTDQANFPQENPLMTRVTRRLSVVTALVVALAVMASGCTQNEYAWNSAASREPGPQSAGIGDVLAWTMCSS